MKKSDLTHSLRFLFRGLLSIGLMVPIVMSGTVRGQSAPVSAPAQPELPQMLDITWTKGPSLPQGFQDSDGGIIHDTLITIAGFCSGRDGKNVPGKPDKYPREFMRKVWGLNLKKPQQGWQVLPDFPGVARQGLEAAVVEDQIYCWGGVSYEKPYAYKDGYRLSQRKGDWVWDRLRDLPVAIGNFTPGSCVIGSKIYVMGGADYDLEKFYTNTDRTGQVKRLGARFQVIDTKNLDAGWKELPSCPGTPRFVHAVAAVGGKIYVIGGATGLDNPANTHCTVVDNWRSDPQTEQWERLADLPVASGNFPAGPIVYQDRYILLIGGAQYSKVANPDGTLRDIYGKVTHHYADNPYFSDVFVYDTKIGRFGRATPLPLNNNMPMAVVQGDRLHLIGGEIQHAVIEGEHFGHHPDLYLIGTIGIGVPADSNRQ